LIEHIYSVCFTDRVLWTCWRSYSGHSPSIPELWSWH